MRDETIYPFPNFNGSTIKVWERIRNFIPHFILNVNTYPCLDKNQTMLVNGALDISQKWTSTKHQQLVQSGIYTGTCNIKYFYVVIYPGCLTIVHARQSRNYSIYTPVIRRKRWKYDVYPTPIHASIKNRTTGSFFTINDTIYRYISVRL